MAAVDTQHITFTAFGVPVDVSVPARLHTGALALTPPGSRDGVAAEGDLCRVRLEEQIDRLRITVQGVTAGVTANEDLGLAILGAQIRAQVALRAPEHIFVRAGVVAVGGRTAVLPGLTFAGKTTLTRALVKAGAVCYSDEFAVLDRDGLVHPYAAPSLDARSKCEPAPVALVAVTAYRPGATLRCEPLTTGAAMLALLGYTVPARTRPRQAMSALKVVMKDATAWTSDRGEAVEAAGVIMESLS